jgi:hypothetical protein
MTRVRAATAAMILGAALSGPVTAKDRCTFLCGNETDATGTEAAKLLTVDLGGPLPAGLEVIGYVEGGFQDRILEVRLHGTRAGAEVMLALLGQKITDVSPDATPMAAVIARDWWDLEPAKPIPQIETRGPHLDYITIGILPDPSDPGMLTIYMLGFDS